MNFAMSDPRMIGLLRDGGFGRFLSSANNDENGLDHKHDRENVAAVRVLERNIEGPEGFGVEADAGLPANG
jgi:hypothetical protein